MGNDAGRAIRCLAKNLDSLVVHYRFDQKCWVALRTTNAIEAINRQFKIHSYQDLRRFYFVL